MPEHAEDRLRALVAAATPGPWVAHFSIHGDPWLCTDPDRFAFTAIAKLDTWPDDYGRANNLAIAALRNNADVLLDVVAAARVLASHTPVTRYEMLVCPRCDDAIWPCEPATAAQIAVRDALTRLDEASA